MFTAAFLSVAGLGFMAWLLFTLAVYALPFFAAVSAGMFAYESGAGPLGAVAIAFVAGAITLAVGQVIFATVRSPVVRSLIAAAYAAPAGLAGYHAVHGMSGIGGTTEPWRIAFSVVGAVIIAGVAWARVSALYPGLPAQGVRTTSYPNTALGAANDG